MRLKNYIIESYKKNYRGTEISIDDVLRISRHYSDAIENLLNNRNAIIMTRSTGQLIDYKYINPKKEEPRVSRNTFNYYTLIIDNSKLWSKYPKRSQSIICLNNSYQKMIDYYYWIIPKNKAIIGECQEHDFWFSFSKITSNMDTGFTEIIRIILNLPYLSDIKYKYNDKPIIKNINQDNIYDYIREYNIKMKRFDINISEFKKACKNFDRWFKKQNIISINDLVFNFSRDNKWMKKWKGESFYNFLEKIINPNENGFRITNVKNLKDNKESWTDAECLIINYSNIKELLLKYEMRNKK